jgi:hypothetical protein
MARSTLLHGKGYLPHAFPHLVNNQQGGSLQISYEILRSREGYPRDSEKERVMEE